ncbi:MAG: tRNA (guanosine(37)-N1)-methyltransferase TrmD, partial [Alphaproteobacteria bacterium]
MDIAKPLLQISILTIFPEIFPGPLACSLAGQALKNNLWSLNIFDIKEFGIGRHFSVDDKPYGGGNGMVMRPDVISNCLDKAITYHSSPKIIYMSPHGKILDQSKVRELKEQKELIIICGRFEAIDQRILNEYNIEEISLGDFILSGGEVAAFPLIDACIRLVPGVLKNSETVNEESFGEKEPYSFLLEYPQYTRPESWRKHQVPEILLSGNHNKIKEWRLRQAENLTKSKRK